MSCSGLEPGAAKLEANASLGLAVSTAGFAYQFFTLVCRWLNSQHGVETRSRFMSGPIKIHRLSNSRLKSSAADKNCQASLLSARLLSTQGSNTSYSTLISHSDWLLVT